MPETGLAGRRWSVRGQPAPRSARRRPCPPGSGRRRTACASGPPPRGVPRPAAGSGPRGHPGRASIVRHCAGAGLKVAGSSAASRSSASSICPRRPLRQLGRGGVEVGARAGDSRSRGHEPAQGRAAERNLRGTGGACPVGHGCRGGTWLPWWKSSRPARARPWSGDGRAQEVLDRAAAEHEALQQRVARQPVCPLRPGAGDLAGGIQAGNGRAAPQVGAHAAHPVVGGRGDGDRFCGPVVAGGEGGRRDGREPPGQEARAPRLPRCHGRPGRPGCPARPRWRPGAGRCCGRRRRGGPVRRPGGSPA